MLSNEINAIKISSSKYKTYKFLQKNSIPTLKTFNVEKNDLKNTKKWVAKPDDGVGCEENYIFSNKKNLFNFLNLNKNFIAQPLVKGVSYSANVIPIKNKVFILNFNKQEISYEKKK